MSFYVAQSLNSLAFAGLLFILSAGFSLIFGLMRIPNLSHGAYFMLGAYIGLTLLTRGMSFWAAALGAGLAIALLGGIVERLILRRLAGRTLSQVLATLGIAFMIADACLWIWSGDPMQLPGPNLLRGVARVLGTNFPIYRLAVIGLAVAIALGLWALQEKTRMGAMVRAGVDDLEMARAVGIPVKTLFTAVFCLGAGLAGLGGVIAGPILSVYPGLDADMLPLALVVVILGGVGSLLGAFVGSIVIGFIYTFGQALLPDLAYVILFLPMVVILVVRPRGLFGRAMTEVRASWATTSAGMTAHWVPACAGMILLFVALPFAIGSDYYINLASQILIAAVFAMGLNLLVGYGGMVSLGHAAYLGFSAYATGWLMLHTGLGPLASGGVALAATTLMAAFFGLLALRATGLSFLMITLALGQILWGLAYRWVGVTGGDNGLTGLTRPAPFGIDLAGALPFYFFTLGVFAVAFVIIALFVHSPFGASLQGTRDQPRRMAALGHNVWMVRWVTFILAGFWGSVAGVLYVYYNTYISPHAVSLQHSAEVLLMVLAGGPATILGPLVGAALVLLVKNIASGYIERWTLLLGAIFVFIVVFLPDGIVPGVKRLYAKWRAAAGSAATAKAET